ncbi:MAG: hypothetical protein LAQ30_08150, partial [Acidobacteriia bacterium]|nr:hypothetical protein [Terriglobia bacterium]
LGVYHGLKVADKTAAQYIATSIDPGNAASLYIVDGSDIRAWLYNVHGGGPRFLLNGGVNGYVDVLGYSDGGYLYVHGPSSRTFLVDASKNQIAIGSGMDFSVSGNAALTTTISFAKSGGGSGTLTFTKGILTGST